MSHRHLCVFGRFDAAPRENPWTGAVEREEAAAPFHDEAERLAEELLGPLALGARAGSDGRTIAYDSALERLTFAVSPALSAWLARERPELLARLAAADRASGGSAALATAFVRARLPLLSRRDKKTLVRWGLDDFRARFGREARGFWLPEGAVDGETLDVLAGEGVAFVVLEPGQAEAVRPAAGGDWTPVDAESLDPKTPYLWRSAAGPERALAAFFVHRRLSRGLDDGEALASAESLTVAVTNRLLPGDAAQLVHASFDGERLLRRRPGAERPLALALELLAGEGVAATTQARFLELFPPPREAKLRPDSSWESAPPDDGRRAPLREALLKLAARLDALYEDAAGLLLKDPWAARDEAAALFLAPDAAAQDAWLDARAKRTLLAEDRSRVLRLLALQRERLAMFDDRLMTAPSLAGEDALLVLARAARAVELAHGLGEEVEAALLERLTACREPGPPARDAATVWKRLVRPRATGLERAAAHAAILDHLGFASAATPALRWELSAAFRADKTGLAGRPRTLSCRPASAYRPETREGGRWVAVVHRADRLDFACWLLPEGASSDSSELGRLFLELDDDAFRAALDARAGRPHFALDALFPDDRAEVVKALASEGAHGAARAAFLARWGECVSALRRGGTQDDPVLALLEEAGAFGFQPHELPWASALEARLHARLEAVIAAPADPAPASAFLRWLDALSELGLVNAPWRLREGARRWRAALDAAGERGAALDAYRALGERLGHAETLQETT